MQLDKITPDYLSNFVNFNFNDPNWQYNPLDGFSIAKIQAEGAAKCWNTLLEKNVALLADEVGMGKTIQALAVMVTLWQQKPDAKILLYAPNGHVARKWIREYENFIRYHYRIIDNNVKSTIQGQPIRSAIFCDNHIDLMKEVNKKWPSLYVCKTSSLSNFNTTKLTAEVLEDLKIKHAIAPTVDRTRPKNDKEKEIRKEQLAKLDNWMASFGIKCNDHIYKQIKKEGPPFDLIIFDEAHYLRRTDSDSNRSIAAHAFFSGNNIVEEKVGLNVRPLAERTLLLTATPNHSEESDINNIVGLFNPTMGKKSAKEILNDICVRRFRRLENKTKHNYRLEIPQEVEMKSLSERLFFAAYHKSLVKHQSEEAQENNARKHNPYHVLFGYLEGFEFLPQNENDKKESEGDDFHKTKDTEVIINLSKTFKQAYKKRPEHPKYLKTVQDLQPTLDNSFAPDKKLVFVRRIASVFEIAQRVIDGYDESYYHFLSEVFGAKAIKKIRNNSKRFFYSIGKTEEPLDDGKAVQTNEEQALDGISNIESNILALFTKRKEGKYRNNDCSNFRLRMLKKDQIFSIFFEPGADYQGKRYKLNKNIIHQQSKKLFKSSVQLTRILTLPENQNERLILSQKYELNNTITENNTEQKLEFDTLFTIWLNSKEPDASKLNKFEAAKSEYLSFTIFEKEAISNYLEKGLLFSSRFMVIFYAKYRYIRKTSAGLKGEHLYVEFCRLISEIIRTSGLADLMETTILSFRIFYKKELGLTPETVHNATWSFLNNSLPVYPYCADTKRDTVLTAFNTPFYPDVLVSTSILQEGVDLHYHCSNVTHYGIAWTQGDNEQRVGRVDRMFGKLEKNLKENPDATLPINYPYLKNTLDEIQVANFIQAKRESEKLVDQLKDIHFKTNLNLLEHVEEKVWKSCFNTPNNSISPDDPFPVIYSKDFNLTPPAIKEPNQFDHAQAILGPLYKSLYDHYGNNFVLFDTNSNEEKEVIFAIKNIRPNLRHQPIVCRIKICEPGLHILSKQVFVLRFTSPLAKSDRNFDGIYKYDILKTVYKNNPTVKICMDPSIKGTYKYYVSADLPLFIHSKNEINLSHNEIAEAINSVIEITDELERIIFDGRQDIKNEDVITSGEELQDFGSNVGLSANRKHQLKLGGWNKGANEKYLVKRKECNAEYYRDTYIFNHKHLLLRQVFHANQAFIEGGLYAPDALEDELILLDNLIKLT